MAIIDQQVPGTRLPGYSSTPTGVDVGAGGHAGESGQQQRHGWGRGHGQWGNPGQGGAVCRSWSWWKSGLRLMAVIGDLLHVSHVAGTMYNHQPRVTRDDCIRPPSSWIHQAGEFYSLLGKRTGHWTVAIIDQHVPGTRLPGCMPAGVGHDHCHAMASHTQTILTGQTKETRRMNVSECADWVNERQVMLGKVVVESLPFLGRTTTAWKLSTLTTQIGSLVACLEIIRAALKLFCRHVYYQNLWMTEGQQAWRSRRRAQWSSRRRSSRENRE